MDHKTFLTSVPPETMAALSRRSDARGLAQLAGHLGAIVLVGGLIAAQVPLWWALLPVQGLLLVFLFTLTHECTHKTPFASGWLNEAAGHLAGAMILLPFIWFRYFHLAHHRWTNLSGKDPELDEPKPQTRAQWVWHVSGLPTWAGSVRQLVDNARGSGFADYVPERARPRVIREARVMIVLYAVALVSLLFSPLLFWVWILPLLLGQPFLRIYLMAEHGRCPEVSDMFDNTRTTFTNRAMRALAWNMPYHVEHHVAPNVPFHQLPAFHRLIRERLRHTADGYTRFTAAWVKDL